MPTLTSTPRECESTTQAIHASKYTPLVMSVYEGGHISRVDLRWRTVGIIHPGFIVPRRTESVVSLSLPRVRFAGGFERGKSTPRSTIPSGSTSDSW